MAESNCVFCMILAGDVPGTIVARTERAAAFMDVNPATRGHLLVVPRAHVPDIHAAWAEDLTAVTLLAQQMARLLKDRLHADGVNIIQANGEAAWQTVFHLHFHVIPRYADDPLVLPWQPKPGDPDEIAATGQLLEP